LDSLLSFEIHLSFLDIPPKPGFHFISETSLKSLVTSWQILVETNRLFQLYLPWLELIFTNIFNDESFHDLLLTPDCRLNIILLVPMVIPHKPLNLFRLCLLPHCLSDQFVTIPLLLQLLHLLVVGMLLDVAYPQMLSFHPLNRLLWRLFLHSNYLSPKEAWFGPLMILRPLVYYLGYLIHVEP